MSKCKELAEENMQLKSLILMYQGEGEDEIPEEKEWRDLVASSRRLSAQETKRVRELAIIIRQQCNATWLRGEVERLNQEVASQAAEIGRLQITIIQHGISPYEAKL